MTDLEISKALALAIGYKLCNVEEQCNSIRVPHRKETAFDSTWRVFDYRDWAVAGPIAERFDCFPSKSVGEKNVWWARNQAEWVNYYADTPQKAIALAVIAAKGGEV